MIPQKEKIIKLILVLFPNSKIYLFGSRAKGTFDETSDIDLAIDANKELSIFDLEQARNVIRALNIAQTVDIVDINSIPKKMKKLIFEEGILWTS